MPAAERRMTCPVAVLDVDLAGPAPAIDGVRDDGTRVTRAFVLVRCGAVPLRAAECGAYAPGRAAELRERGFNCVIVPTREGDDAAWVDADRVGLLVLGRVGDPLPSPGWLARVSRRPSCLGWVATASVAPALAGHKAAVGLDLSAEGGAAIPGGIAFLVGTPEQLSPLAPGRALLVRGVAEGVEGVIGHVEVP